MLLNALCDEGYNSYFVGGAVRDKLLGFEPKDYDIITTAPPQVVKYIVDKYNWQIKDVGASFGVLLIIIDGYAFEVSTARREWYDDKDAHRPAGVIFCGSVEEDLSRRDFTINALAEDRNGDIIDPFGGARDLQEKIIRTVGEPLERLFEDALRAFRAARFSAQLGFNISPDIFEAIQDENLQSRLRGLSVERVVQELEKTLTTPYPEEGFSFLMASGLLNCYCRSREDGEDKQISLLPELTHLAGLPQNPRYHQLDVWNHTLVVSSVIPAQRELRWAALLHDVAKGMPGVRTLNRRGEISDPGHDKKGAEITANILFRLKIPPQTVQRVTWLVSYHMRFPQGTDKAIKRWLKKIAAQFRSKEDMKEAVEQLFELLYADLKGKGKDVSPRLLEVDKLRQKTFEILNTTPFFVKELNIRGGEIAEKLGSGPQVNKFLQDTLTRVINGELSNDHVSLKEALTRRAFREKGVHGKNCQKGEDDCGFRQFPGN